jgi:antitoxin YefM
LYNDAEESMDAISYSTARKNMVQTMDRVCDNHEAVIITRQKARPVIMMSLEDYNSIEETLHLLKNPANARRLAQAIKELEEGKICEKELIEPWNLFSLNLLGRSIFTGKPMIYQGWLKSTIFLKI